MSAGRDKLVRDLVIVQATGVRRVGLLRSVERQFRGLDQRWKKRLERHFRNYCTPNTTLPPEQFKSEGRFPTGGLRSKEVQVFAFKAFQHRLYGVVESVNGIPTFVGMELVEDKKTNRADQDLLRRVARNFAPYSN